MINTNQCVTTSYGRVKGLAKQYPYFQAARYERRTLKNGKTVWFYLGHLGTARRSWRKAQYDAKAFADKLGCEYKQGIRHLAKV